MEASACVAYNAQVMAVNLELLLKCFRARAPLLREGAELVASLVSCTAEYRAGCAIAMKKEPFARGLFILAGWVSRARDLPTGQRQLIDLYLPGEIVVCRRDQEVRHLCLTDVKCVDVTELIARTEAAPSRYPGVTAALREFSADAERRLIEQIARLGAMRAAERVASFALDLYQRLHVAGLCRDGRFAMALSQEQIGCLLGISAVHVNRTLQQLKRMDLIRRDQDGWTLVDKARLKAIGEYKECAAPSVEFAAASRAPRPPLRRAEASSALKRTRFGQL